MVSVNFTWVQVVPRFSKYGEVVSFEKVFHLTKFLAFES